MGNELRTRSFSLKDIKDDDTINGRAKKWSKKSSYKDDESYRQQAAPSDTICIYQVY